MLQSQSNEMQFKAYKIFNYGRYLYEQETSRRNFAVHKLNYKLEHHVQQDIQ